MLRKIGSVLVIGSILLFVVAFLNVIAVSGCGTTRCFQAEDLWGMVLMASILAFVGGVMMIAFGGRGYGKTKGPRDFSQVDAGEWAPRQMPDEVSPGGERQHRKWTRIWRNLYVYVGAGETGLALLFVIGAFVQSGSRSGFFLTAGVLGAVGVIFLWLGARTATKDRLHVTGIEGRATIIGLNQTGMWMNDNPYVKLDLVIRIDGHPPYEVEHGEIVPQVLLGRLTDGSTLPVKVDPSNPSHFLVEWERA